jgi:hypothetical protein
MWIVPVLRRIRTLLFRFDVWRGVELRPKSSESMADQPSTIFRLLGEGLHESQSARIDPIRRRPLLASGTHAAPDLIRENH